VQTSAAHQGLVLRPLILVGTGERTSPPHRGATLRAKVLCAQLGLPDPDAVSDRASDVGDLSALPNRQGFEKLTDSPACSGCHQVINPVGFALEGYDQLGMVRTTEIVLNAEHREKARFPVDTRVTDPVLVNASGGHSFENAAELVTAMAQSEEGRSCFAQSLFEWQRLRAFKREDSCALRDTESRTTHVGTALEAFVSGIANDDIFWRSL